MIEDGIISFEPMDGQGSKDGASIIKGEYRIPRDKGLMPGRYKVRIYAGDGIPTGGRAEPTAPPPGSWPRSAASPLASPCWSASTG